MPTDPSQAAPPPGPATTTPDQNAPPDPAKVQLAFAMDLRLAGRDDDARAVLALTPDEFMAAGHGQDQADPPAPGAAGGSPPG